MKLSEKVAYLKGLEEGLAQDNTSSAENKLIRGIIEAFDDIVAAIDTNTTDLQEMTARVDEIDTDLGDLEAILFEGFNVEELTEDDLGISDEDFAVVYTTDKAEEAPVEEKAIEVDIPQATVQAVEDDDLDDAAIFAAADEVVLAAEAEEAVEEPVIVEEVEEVVVEEAPEEEVEEIIEREAEPEEDTYEVECPSCGHIMYIDDSVLAQGSIECPQCHELLEFEIEYED